MRACQRLATTKISMFNISQRFFSSRSRRAAVAAAVGLAASGFLFAATGTLTVTAESKLGLLGAGSGARVVYIPQRLLARNVVTNLDEIIWSPDVTDQWIKVGEAIDHDAVNKNLPALPPGDMGGAIGEYKNEHDSRKHFSEGNPNDANSWFAAPVQNLHVGGQGFALVPVAE